MGARAKRESKHSNKQTIERMCVLHNAKDPNPNKETQIELKNTTGTGCALLAVDKGSTKKALNLAIVS